MESTNKNRVLSELASVSSAFLLAIMAVLVKLSAASLDGVQISFFRFFIGGILSVFFLIIFRQKFLPVGWIPVMGRAVLGSVSMVIFYVAIGLSSGGRATLLNNLYPFFVVIFGAFFFNDKIRVSQILFMLISFVGSVMVFYDGSHYPLIANLLAVSSALIVGLSVNFMKEARKNNNSMMIYLWICLFGLVITIPSMFSSVPILKSLSAMDWILVCGNAVVAFVAQFLFMWGQKYLTAVRNSFLQFSKMPFTLFLSIVFLQEEMTVWFWIGSVFITAGLLLDTVFIWSGVNKRKDNPEIQ
ncbi:MAG: DMT family transporter [Fibrobacter sp.]|nr:DMT family transporter [Fibrobacter sp.]